MQDETVRLSAALIASQKTEEFYRNVLQQTQEGLVVYDHTLHIRLWNPAVEQMLGLSAFEAIGRHSTEVLPVLHDAALFDDLKAALAGSTVLSVDTRITSSDDAPSRWISARHAPLRGTSGAVMGVISSIRDVTAQRESKERLRESEELFRKVFEESPQGIAISGPDLRYRHVNPSFCDMLGYSENELIGRNYVDITHPDDLENDAEHMHDLLAGSLAFTSRDKRYLRKNGEPIWVNRAGTLVYAADGSPQFYLTMVRNIDARKRMEDSLRQSEEQFRTVVENLTEGLILADMEGNLLHWNRSALEMHGFASNDECRASLAEFERTFEIAQMDGTKLPLTHWPMARLLRGDLSHPVELRVRRFDQAWSRICRYGGSGVQDASGRQLVFLTVTDITERNSAEMALHESEERFRTLVNDLPIPVWMLDSNGKFALVNRAWEQITGCSAEAAHRFEWKDAISADDVGAVRRTYRKQYRARDRFAIEFHFTRLDGRQLYLMNIGVPRFLEDGAFLGYIGASVDLSEQKALQEQLMQAQRLESLGRLAGGIAHDFNNLLTAISGYAELARDALPAGGEITGYLRNVLNASDRAAALTKQLLTYSRQQMVDTKNLDLNAIFLRMDPLLRRTIGEMHELVLTLQEQPWTVQANASQMEQILLNLVVNSCDAQPNGGRIVIETANVTLDAEYAAEHVGVVPGDYVEFSVSDNGAGMTRDIQARVFEPFFTTKEPGKGTGLGLATCYGIVKQSRGNIWVYSEPGHGTTFKVYLPRTHEPPIQEQEESAPAEPQSGGATILLVDDEPLVRDIAARILRGHGYSVIEASNGPDALRCQREGKLNVDLLITDVVMPTMSGKELADRIQEVLPGTKTLYVSGYTHNVILHQGILKENVHLLTKPFSSTGLLQKVREMLLPDEEG